MTAGLIEEIVIFDLLASGSRYGEYYLVRRQKGFPR
jgi:hypothetical protein